MKKITDIIKVDEKGNLRCPRCGYVVWYTNKHCPKCHLDFFHEKKCWNCDMYDHLSFGLCGNCRDNFWYEANRFVWGVIVPVILIFGIIRLIFIFVK